MRWLLVSTLDDARLVKQDNSCVRCFKHKARTTVLRNEPLADGEERTAWFRMVRAGDVRAYGAVSCECFRGAKICGQP